MHEWSLLIIHLNLFSLNLSPRLVRELLLTLNVIWWSFFTLFIESLSEQWIPSNWVTGSFRDSRLTSIASYYFGLDDFSLWNALVKLCRRTPPLLKLIYWVRVTLHRVMYSSWFFSLPYALPFFFCLHQRFQLWVLVIVIFLEGLFFVVE